MLLLLFGPIVPPRTRLFSSIFLTFLALLTASARSGAQFSAGVSLVEVYATVTDGRGEPMTSLSADDFSVEEDNVPQTISAFASGEVPLSLAIAIDRSFSVPRAQFQAMTSAVGGLMKELRPEDETMVIAIGSEVEVVSPLSTDRAAAGEQLKRIEPWGTTPLFDAALGAMAAIQPAKGRRALVLLSDGDDRYSAATAAAVLTTARQNDVLIYPVAVGKRRPAIFAEMASVSGGRSFHVDDTRALPSVLSTIARELRSQYLLGYSPLTSPSERPGWRSIRVQVKRPDVRVRARDGYVAR
jgi:Ca-activated chloride channel family protein